MAVARSTTQQENSLHSTLYLKVLQTAERHIGDIRSTVDDHYYFLKAILIQKASNSWGKITRKVESRDRQLFSELIAY